MFRLKFIGGYNVKSVVKFSNEILKNNKVPVFNYAI